MQEHFNFTDEQMKDLAKKKVGVADLFKFANDFDPTGNKSEVGLINLLTFVDKKGNFTEKPFFKQKHICNAIFDNLDIKDKICVHEYIADMEDVKF